MSQDEETRAMNNLEKSTKEYISKIEQISEKKQKELMEI